MTIPPKSHAAQTSITPRAMLTQPEHAALRELTDPAVNTKNVHVQGALPPEPVVGPLGGVLGAIGGLVTPARPHWFLGNPGSGRHSYSPSGSVPQSEAAEHERHRPSVQR